MDWISRTQFSNEVKSFSYAKCLEVWGEKRGAEVAKHFGIKPEKKKRVKKEEPKEEAGE